MRYSGSKRRFAKKLIPIITEGADENTHYYEPFAGGMNLICEVPLKNKHAFDINRYIIALWEHIQNNVKNGLDVLYGLPSYVDEEMYYTVRKAYQNASCDFSDAVIGLVGAMCSYGGGWFCGYAKFNHKRGEDHIKEAFNNIRKQAENFKGLSEMEIKNVSYDKYYGYINGSIILCDPPYAETKRYESDFDNESFWIWAQKMSEKGFKVYVCEYRAPEGWKCVWEETKKDGMGTTKCGCKQNVKVERLFVYDPS